MEHKNFALNSDIRWLPLPFTERSIDSEDDITSLTPGIYLMYGYAPIGLHQEFINKNCLYGTLEVSSVAVGTYYTVVKVVAVNDNMSVGLKKTLFVSRDNNMWID